MIGLFIGDAIGSTYEDPMMGGRFSFKQIPEIGDEFPEGSKFTDDTYLVFALMEHVLTEKPLVDTLRSWALSHPDAGYGGMFARWVQLGSRLPYRSYGNGAAVRAILTGQIYADVEERNECMVRYTSVTHNHPDSIKAGQTVAESTRMCIEQNWKTRPTAEDLTHVQAYCEAAYPRIRDKEVSYYMQIGSFSTSSSSSVPPALLAAYKAKSFREGIQNGLALNNDPDTQAAIAGGIIEGFFKGHPEKDIPTPWLEQAHALFDVKMTDLYQEFLERFGLER